MEYSVQRDYCRCAVCCSTVESTLYSIESGAVKPYTTRILNSSLWTGSIQSTSLQSLQSALESIRVDYEERVLPARLLCGTQCKDLKLGLSIFGNAMSICVVPSV